MRTTWLLALLALAIIAPVSAQKNWANAAEYELFERAGNERVPALQIKILLEWETANPNSDFQTDRLAFFVNAYQNAGRPVDAFARATQLFKLDPASITAAGMLATLAPAIDAPSPEQIEITEKAANYLLAEAAEIGRAATAVPQAAGDTAPPHASDPQIERVLAVLRQWRQESRRNQRIRTAAEVESEIRAVAEKALAWAKTPR